MHTKRRRPIERDAREIAAVAPPFPGRLLKRADPETWGDDVQTWQTRAAQLGRGNIPVHGTYGTEAEQLCRAIQTAAGLTVDGIVGPATWKATWELHQEPVVVETGLDRAYAPSVSQARALRDATEASWWGVYIGGVCSAGRYWTPRRVRDLADAGFKCVPIYVGHQAREICSRDQLTEQQARADAVHTARLMEGFGWPPRRGIPVWLDIEAGTYSRRKADTLAYAGAWTEAIRQLGYVPGVYSSIDCLKALHVLPTKRVPDLVWIAAWKWRRVEVPADHSLDPNDVPRMPSDMWATRQRGWQYAGEVTVPGAPDIEVDLSCSNMPLAPAPLTGEPPMSIKDVQEALRTLGWPLHANGQWNDDTYEAVRDFQRGYAFGKLSEDGDPGPLTTAALRRSLAEDGKCSANFYFREFKSRGNGWIKLSRALVLGLERYRKAVGKPVAIISGYRDPAYNDTIPNAAKNSQHVYGNAADIVQELSRRDVRDLRRFSGIGYQPSTDKVRHVDVRHVGPNTTNSSIANPMEFRY